MTNLHANGLPDVGLYVDDERSIAAVSRPTRSTSSLHVASLHRTVLYVHGDGSASLGGTTDPNAAEFTQFVAEEVQSGFAPGDLVAMTLRCLLAEVAQSVGTDPSSLSTAATFPGTWTAERVSDVRMAMNRMGLDHVALVPEAEARSAWAASTQATWAGSDSGIAAARGAASLAQEFPIDAVTEVIAKPRAARPAWARTPVLAAAAFAAVLVLGSVTTAMMLQDSSSPSIPEIENAQIAAPTTTASRPAPNVPFPTVVPIIETVPDVAPASPVPAPVIAPADLVPTTAQPSATQQPAPTQPPTTRPATGTSDAPEESPSAEQPVSEEPTVTVPGENDTEETPDDEATDDTDEDDATGESDESDTDQVGRGPAR